MWDARPAARAQHRGDRIGGLATKIAYIEDSEPQRKDALDRVGRVTSLVTPLLVGRMRRGSIEFYAQQVFLVEIVEVPIACMLPDPHLPSRRRQPMWSFDAPDVAVLKHGRSTRKRRRTPRCSRCQRPLRTRLRIVSGATSDSAPWRRAIRSPWADTRSRARGGMSVAMRPTLHSGTAARHRRREPVDNPPCGAG